MIIIIYLFILFKLSFSKISHILYTNNYNIILHLIFNYIKVYADVLLDSENKFVT